MALSFSAGSLCVVANNNNSKSSILSSGFVPRTVSFPYGSSKSTASNSFAVKAESNPEGSNYFPFNYSFKPALFGTLPHVRTPWGHDVTEENIKMAFVMPGVEASELDVIIRGDELSIMFNGPKDKKDAVGREITGLYDTKIQMSPNYVSDKTEAEFKNGVLYVTIPRISIDRAVPFKVPVRDPTKTPTKTSTDTKTETN